MKIIFLFLFLFVFCSCDSFFDEKRKLFPVRYQKSSSSSIHRLLSVDPLSGILSKEYYLIKAVFQKDQSRLRLFSHFQGFEHMDGIQIQMERKGNQLLIRLAIQSYPPRILFEKQDYFLHTNELDLTVEAQNGTNYGFRVRIWENFFNKSNVLRVPESVLTERNLIVDSLSKKLNFYNKGQGLKWGVELFRVRLIEGARVSPRLL